MKENKNIEKANEILCSLSEDEIERDLAYRRERAIRDINTAIKSGYNEGKIATQKEIIKNMLKENIDIETIAKVTNISVEKVKEMVK